MNYTHSINTGYQISTRILQQCKVKANDPSGEVVVKSSAFPVTSLTGSVNVNAIVLGINSSGGSGGVLELRSKLLNTRSFIQIDPSDSSSTGTTSVVTQGKYFPRSSNLALASSNGSGYDEELRISYNTFQNNDKSLSLADSPISTIVVNNQGGTITTNDWTDSGFIDRKNVELVLEYDNTNTWRVFLPRGSRIEAMLSGTTTPNRPNFLLDGQTFSFLNFSKFKEGGGDSKQGEALFHSSNGINIRVSIDPSTFVNRTVTNIATNTNSSVTNWRGFVILNPSIVGLFSTILDKSEADVLADAILIQTSLNKLIFSKVDNATAYSETLDLLIELSIESNMNTQVGSMYGNC